MAAAVAGAVMVVRQLVSRRTEPESREVTDLRKFMKLKPLGFGRTTSDKNIPPVRFRGRADFLFNA